MKTRFPKASDYDANAVNMFASLLHQFKESVAPEHTVNKVSQWSPEILSTRKTMLIDE